MRKLQLALIALTVGVTATALQLCILRRGIAFTPDSWGYWEGAVSILHGSGYRWFHGDPVAYWPPLFSCYLAAWQWMCGVSGGTLAWALAVAGGVSAALWVIVLPIAVRAGRLSVWPCLFVAAMLAQNERRLMSEHLMNVFVPILVGLAVVATRSRARRRWGAIVATALIGAAMLLTRHSAAALVGAACALLLFDRSVDVRRRILECACIGTVAAVPALLVKHSAGLEWAFPIGVGAGRYGPFEYLAQMTWGLGDRFAPAPVGGVVFGGLFVCGLSRAVPRDARADVRRLLVFVLAASLALYALFNLTYVFAELKGRFLFFAPLVTGMALLSVVGVMPDARLRFALLVVCLALPVGKTAKLAIKGKGMVSTNSDQRALDEHFIRPHFTIDPKHQLAPPRRLRDGRLLVAPPGREWLESQVRSK